MRNILNIILVASMTVWIATTVANTLTNLVGYQYQDLMNISSYSFGITLLFGLEKVVTTENKTKESVKALFDKDKRIKKRRVKKEKRKGCGSCKK